MWPTSAYEYHNASKIYFSGDQIHFFEKIEFFEFFTLPGQPMAHHLNCFIDLVVLLILAQYDLFDFGSVSIFLFL